MIATEVESQAPISMVVPLQTAEEVAHEQDVNAFLVSSGIGEGCKKRKRKLLAMNSHSFQVLKLNSVIGTFCKNMDIDSAFEVYKEAKARNIQPSQSMFYNLLSLSAGFGDLGSGCNTIRDSEPPSDFEVAFAVFRDMQAVGIPMSESAFTAMIRCCCNHNRHKEALSFYQELKSNQSNITPKLRCFTPLLRVFSIAGDQVECETLYDDLTQIYKIIPTEKEYNYMLSVCVCNNCSDVFYTVLEHMQDDVYVPSVATWAIIKEWFGQPRQASSLSMYSVSGVDGTRRSLRSVRDSVSNRVSESGSGSSQPNDELIEYTVCMSSVSEEGVVEINSEQLLSLDLDEPTRQALLEQIEGLATADTTPVSERSSVLIEDGNTATPASIIDTNIITADEPKINKHSVGTSSKETSTGIDDVDEDTHTVSVHQVRKRARKVHKELSPGTRKELFTSFKSYISTLKQKHGDIDVIVDGANVGYYKQNYANAPAHVDYTQINYMIIRLQNLGYKPLIILHCRHINYKYLDLTDEHIDIIETWKKLGLLYSTPAGCNDDWYWLYCAVLLRCKVVTNDEMRDHHFLMLSPRWFDQWKERNQIHFSFGEWSYVPQAIKSNFTDELNVPDTSSSCLDNKEILSACNIQSQQHTSSRWRLPVLSVPSPYSYRVQCIRKQSLSAIDTQNATSVYGFYFPPDVTNSELPDAQLWLCVYAK